MNKKKKKVKDKDKDKNGEEGKKVKKVKKVKKKKKKNKTLKTVTIPVTFPPSATLALREDHPGVTVIFQKPTLFDCKLYHGLTLRAVPVDGGAGIACDWCDAAIPAGRHSVGCRACDMDACMDCAATKGLELANGNASRLTCRCLDGLVLTQRPPEMMMVAPQFGGPGGGRSRVFCDFCRRSIEVGAKTYSCGYVFIQCCAVCMIPWYRSL